MLESCVTLTFSTRDQLEQQNQRLPNQNPKILGQDLTQQELMDQNEENQKLHKQELQAIREELKELRMLVQNLVQKRMDFE